MGSAAGRGCGPGISTTRLWSIRHSRSKVCPMSRPRCGPPAVGCWIIRNWRSSAVGHRVVHGGPKYDRPTIIDDQILEDLARYAPLAPLHQPNNLTPIRAIRGRFPQLPQVACFDTAFHRGHNSVADHFAIPKSLYAEGVRRYGFHGLSYEYIAGRLKESFRTLPVDA